MNKKIIIAGTILVILSALTVAFNINKNSKFETQAECETKTGEKCKCMLSKSGSGYGDPSSNCLDWATVDTIFR